MADKIYTEEEYQKHGNTAYENGRQDGYNKRDREINYDYEAATLQDIYDFVKDEINIDEWMGNRSGLEEYLNEDAQLNYSVTGSDNGSYYCNTYKAEEALCHNWDLVTEMAEEYGLEHVMEKGAEYCDMLVRDYVYRGEISNALDKYEKETGIMIGSKGDHEYAGQFDTLMADLEAEGFDIATGTYTGYKPIKPDDYNY